VNRAPNLILAEAIIVGMPSTAFFGLFALAFIFGSVPMIIVEPSNWYYTLAIVALAISGSIGIVSYWCAFGYISNSYIPADHRKPCVGGLVVGLLTAPAVWLVVDTNRAVLILLTLPVISAVHFCYLVLQLPEKENAT